MITLFVSELRYFMNTEVYQELFVDTMRWHKIEIDMDITFPRWNCECKSFIRSVVASSIWIAFSCLVITIDAMDVTGEQQIDVEHTILKRRLDLTGEVIEENIQHRKSSSPICITWK